MNNLEKAKFEGWTSIIEVDRDRDGTAVHHDEMRQVTTIYSTLEEAKEAAGMCKVVRK